MYTHIQARAIAITAMATLLAAACGGSRSIHRTADSDVFEWPSRQPVHRRPLRRPPLHLLPPTSRTRRRSLHSRRIGYADAVPMFDAYTVRHPDNVWAHYMLGVSAWKGGTARQGARRIRRAHSPAIRRTRRVSSTWAAVLLEEQRPSEALDRIQPSPGDRFRLRRGVAGCSGESRGASVTAMKRSPPYRSAIALDSTDSWSMNNMGLLADRMKGQYADAMGATRPRGAIGLRRGRVSQQSRHRARAQRFT